jgi:signal recognition particle receptor subunit beta
MALIDLNAREIHGKIVYFGPGLGGKTTNLLYLHAHLPDAQRGEMMSIAGDSGRTLFFDLMPVNLGTVLGFAIRFRLYTVAGQERYEEARATVMTGADGVVFVADAQRGRLRENLASLRELAAVLRNQGKSLSDFPLVLQYNKMDLPDALPVETLDRYLNPMGTPRIEAVALQGCGVVETLRAVCKRTAQSL